MTTDGCGFRRADEVVPVSGDPAVSWRCPVDWHRGVKRHGDHTYCIEPGCWHSNIEQTESAR